GFHRYPKTSAPSQTKTEVQHSNDPGRRTPRPALRLRIHPGLKPRTVCALVSPCPQSRAPTFPGDVSARAWWTAGPKGDRPPTSGPGRSPLRASALARDPSPTCGRPTNAPPRDSHGPLAGMTARTIHCQYGTRYCVPRRGQSRGKTNSQMQEERVILPMGHRQALYLHRVVPSQLLAPAPPDAAPAATPDAPPDSCSGAHTASLPGTSRRGFWQHLETSSGRVLYRTTNARTRSVPTVHRVHQRARSRPPTSPPATAARCDPSKLHTGLQHQ